MIGICQTPRKRLNSQTMVALQCAALIIVMTNFHPSLNQISTWSCKNISQVSTYIKHRTKTPVKMMSNTYSSTKMRGFISSLKKHVIRQMALSQSKAAVARMLCQVDLQPHGVWLTFNKGPCLQQGELFIPCIAPY